jgi:hypothetical protein
MRRIDSTSFEFALGDRDHIEASLRRALVSPALDRSFLSDEIRAFTRRARAGGQPIERVIIAVKSMVDDTQSASPDITARRHLAEEVVRWCIEEFYGNRPADL